MERLSFNLIREAVDYLGTTFEPVVIEEDRISTFSISARRWRKWTDLDKLISYDTGSMCTLFTYGHVFVCGGLESEFYLERTAYVLDIAGLVTNRPSMSESRVMHGLVYTAQGFYVFGGLNRN